MSKDELRGEVMQLYALLANTVDSYRSTVECSPAEFEEILKNAIREKLGGDDQIGAFLDDKFGENLA